MVYGWNAPVVWDGSGEPVETGSQTAVADYAEPGWGNVAWWHWCSRTSTSGEAAGWVPCGLGKHDVTGSVAGADLTVSPSVLCLECGKHGFLTNMQWRDC